MFIRMKCDYVRTIETELIMKHQENFVHWQGKTYHFGHFESFVRNWLEFTML